MQAITPFIWFDSNAEEALNFYTELFPNSVIKNKSYYGPNGHGRPEGSLMSATFELNGVEFIVLNGGPYYQITGGISFLVNCETQSEIDHYWKAFAQEGQEIQCGWITDKFGVTWQITPNCLGACLGHPDPAKAQKAMQAMMGMKKLEIQKLLEAVAD